MTESPTQYGAGERDGQETIANPQRGCGTIERGKAYLRGLSGEGRGVLPSWVQIDPPIPFREIGTEGQFTRSFKKIDGLTLQLATSGNHHYQPTCATGSYEEHAFERMVENGLYDTRMEIPKEEVHRHIDRIEERGQMDYESPAAIGDAHWGAMPVASQTDLLMRAGESYYPEPEDYAEECRKHGLSKAIPVSANREPPTVVEGITRCWVLHPAAGDEVFGGAVIGYSYLGSPVFTEPEDGSVPNYIEGYEQNGDLDVVDVAEPDERISNDEAKNMTLEDAIENGDDA